MEIVTGNYGECRICDNMDPSFGLPSLKAKSWDLCLTDPPYGEEKQHNDGRVGGDGKVKCCLYPKTNNELFKELTFVEIVRITNNQILWGGNYYPFLPFNSRGQIIWDKRCKEIHNDFADGELAWSSFDNSLRILHCLWNGMHRLNQEERFHPFQKPLPLWRYCMKYANPTSVLDPFLGSGTTAEVCEEMGIPWLGYEIMPEYIPDIKKRIERGIGKHKTYRKQTTLQIAKK